MNKDMKNLFHELKQYLPQYSMKWHTLCDIEKYILDLERKLGEKDKIIDEILNHPFFTNECPYSSIGDGFVQELCDCDNCQEDYKKCWIKYFKNEILERGKN